VKQSFTNGLSRPEVFAALDALAWPADSLLDVEILGARLAVAFSFNATEIARREAEQLWPQSDPRVLRCVIDLDPGFATRPSPVRLVGALAARRTWRTASEAATVFTAFGPRAAVLPPEQCTRTPLLEASVLGVGVVSWDGTQARCLVPVGARPAARRTFVHRLVEETVWAAARDQGTVAADEVRPAAST
jgi:hypothetical protein